MAELLYLKVLLKSSWLLTWDSLLLLIPVFEAASRVIVEGRRELGGRETLADWCCHLAACGGAERLGADIPVWREMVHVVLFYRTWFRKRIPQSTPCSRMWIYLSKYLRWPNFFYFSLRKKVFTLRRKLFSAEICFSPRRKVFTLRRKLFSAEICFSLRKKVFTLRRNLFSAEICFLWSPGSAHDLVIRAHDLLIRAQGLVIRAHGFVIRAHELITHGLLNPAHGLLSRAHGLVNRAHRPKKHISTAKSCLLGVKTFFRGENI